MQKTVPVIPTINLAKQRGNITDKIINWALSAGRVVIIVTELIALLAFLYRFTLDRQIIDLHGKIKQEDAIVKLLKHNEDTYRNLQTRLALIEKLEGQTTVTEKRYFDVTSFIPTGMQISYVTLSGNSLRVGISTKSIASLGTLIKNMKDYPSIEGVSVDKIENKISTGTISTSITATIKNKM